MHPSSTSGAPVDSDSVVCRPPSEGAGVGYGPVVGVAGLWSIEEQFSRCELT